MEIRDEELYRLTRKGDREAFAMLYLRRTGFITGVAAGGFKRKAGWQTGRHAHRAVGIGVRNELLRQVGSLGRRIGTGDHQRPRQILLNGNLPSLRISVFETGVD